MAKGFINTTPAATSLRVSQHHARGSHDEEGLTGLLIPRQRPRAYGWVNTAPETLPNEMTMRNKAMCSQRQSEILSGQ